MKYNYLILTLTLVTFTIEVFPIVHSTYNITNTCSWIESLNNHTKQLTSDGQQVLLDLQIYIRYIH